MIASIVATLFLFTISIAFPPLLLVAIPAAIVIGTVYLGRVRAIQAAHAEVVTHGEAKLDAAALKFFL